MSPAAQHGALIAAVALLWGVVGPLQPLPLGLLLLGATGLLLALRRICGEGDGALIAALVAVLHPGVAAVVSVPDEVWLFGVWALSLVCGALWVQPDRRLRLGGLALFGVGLVGAAQAPGGGGGGDQPLDWGLALARVGRTLRDLVLPIDLPPWGPAPTDPTLGLFIVPVVVGAAAAGWRGEKRLAFALVFALLLCCNVLHPQVSPWWSPAGLLFGALGLGLVVGGLVGRLGAVAWVIPLALTGLSIVQAPRWRGPVAGAEAVAAAAPGWAPGLVAPIYALLDAQRIDEAAARLEALGDALPRGPVRFAAEGAVLHAQGQDEAAIPLLESALGGDSDQVGAALLLIEILRSRGDIDGARFHAGRLVALHPEVEAGPALLTELGG